MCLLTLTFSITPFDTNEYCSIEDVVVGNTSTDIGLNSALDGFLIVVAALTEETEIAVGGIDVSFHTTTDAVTTTTNKILESVSAELSKLSLCQGHSQYAPANHRIFVENSQAAESCICKVSVGEGLILSNCRACGRRL